MHVRDRNLKGLDHFGQSGGDWSGLEWRAPLVSAFLVAYIRELVGTPKRDRFLSQARFGG